MEFRDLGVCWSEFEELAADFRQLEKLNREYQKQLEVVGDLQRACEKNIAHQRYRLSLMEKSMDKLRTVSQNYDVEGASALGKKIRDRKEQLSVMEQALPRQSGMYLSVILGSVNVSMLNTSDKFRYKNEYEKFKLVLSVICLLLATANIFTSVRILELALMFLLVWFYSTLTIRESILKVNGSRIKGWWRAHHFISAIAAAVLLIWPTTKPWFEFRTQFMIFSAYISVVQSLQFWYQRGVLYRLKALGERHDMDITIEGFHSWMWKGLSFLVPFLYFGYAFQAYNCYVLFCLSFMSEATWQVPALAVLFALLFAGNLITTSVAITQKLNTGFLQNLYLIPWVTRARSSAMSENTKDSLSSSKVQVITRERASNTEGPSPRLEETTGHKEGASNAEGLSPRLQESTGHGDDTTDTQRDVTKNPGCDGDFKPKKSTHQVNEEELKKLN